MKALLAVSISEAKICPSIQNFVICVILQTSTGARLQLEIVEFLLYF